MLRFLRKWQNAYCNSPQILTSVLLPLQTTAMRTLRAAILLAASHVHATRVTAETANPVQVWLSKGGASHHIYRYGSHKGVLATICTGMNLTGGY